MPLIFLGDVPAGGKFKLPNKRKIFTVIKQDASTLRLKPRTSSEYKDGCNFYQYPATQYKDSRGRKYKSLKIIKVIF